MVRRKKETFEDEKRDMDLENILGNLMITQFQEQRLQSRLAEMYKGYGGKPTTQSSTFTFKYENTHYRVKLNIDSIDLSPKVEDEPEENVGAP